MQKSLYLENFQKCLGSAACELIYKLDSNDKAARQIKTEAMRNMGQFSYSSIGRSFQISEARGLEGKEQIPSAPTSIAADPATFVNYCRVRIDPRKAEYVDKVIAFAFPDRPVALHVRRGIAELVPDSANYLRLKFPDPKQPILLCISDIQFLPVR